MSYDILDDPTYCPRCECAPCACRKWSQNKTRRAAEAAAILRRSEAPAQTTFAQYDNAVVLQCKRDYSVTMREARSCHSREQNLQRWREGIREAMVRREIIPAHVLDSFYETCGEEDWFGFFRDAIRGELLPAGYLNPRIRHEYRERVDSYRAVKRNARAASAAEAR